MVVEPLETILLQYTPDTPLREQIVSLLPERDRTQSQVSGTHFSGRKMQYHPVFTGETRTGLMGSLRIEPAHEQVFPREVKPHEGIETQHDSSPTSRWMNVTLSQETQIVSNTFYPKVALPEHPESLILVGDLNEVSNLLFLGDYQVVPTFGWVLPGFTGSKWLKPLRDDKSILGGNLMSPTQNHPNRELPPLPDRAIGGLSRDWPKSTSQPFHTVRLWEFTNLYVLLGLKVWKILSSFLRGSTLSVISRRLKIGISTLSAICNNRDQTIVVPNLNKLCLAAGLNLEMVERTIRGVRFNKRGSLEHLKFPFAVDIYAWRVLCHIAGDGNVHKRKYPALRWIQLPENQGPMREILQRLSRTCGGESDQIWYPKALTYAIMGTMLGITFSDLRTPTFIQFVIDLPPEYKDWKVQFLAAFIVDDGSISGKLSFNQKDPTTLQYIIRLCEQLGYDHSPLYESKRDGVHNFQLRQEGIQTFYNDLHKFYTKDPLLGLWHKQPNLESVATSFSLMRGFEKRYSIQVCVTIINVLGDHQERDTKYLRNHPKLKPLLEEYEKHWFLRRLELLSQNMHLIEEVLNPNTKKSYRPKHWRIPPSSDAETLIEKFHQNYNNRAHAQSYKRKFITSAMVEEAIAELVSEGIKPTALNVARKIGCSKKQLYTRKDLRRYFIDDEENDADDEEDIQ